MHTLSDLALSHLAKVKKSLLTDVVRFIKDDNGIFGQLF